MTTLLSTLLSFGHPEYVYGRTGNVRNFHAGTAKAKAQALHVTELRHPPLTLPDREENRFEPRRLGPILMALQKVPSTYVFVVWNLLFFVELFAIFIFPTLPNFQRPHCSMMFSIPTLLTAIILVFSGSSDARSTPSRLLYTLPNYSRDISASTMSDVCASITGSKLLMVTVQPGLPPVSIGYFCKYMIEYY